MSSISSLEKQIKDGWKQYKYRSNQCHEIAQRVMNRKRWVGESSTEFAYPEEIAKYDKYARELKEIETYVAERQKELNRRQPWLKKDNLKFNAQQIERLTNVLTNNPN